MKNLKLISTAILFIFVCSANQTYAQYSQNNSDQELLTRLSADAQNLIGELNNDVYEIRNNQSLSLEEKRNSIIKAKKEWVKTMSENHPVDARKIKRHRSTTGKIKVSDIDKLQIVTPLSKRNKSKISEEEKNIALGRLQKAKDNLEFVYEKGRISEQEYAIKQARIESAQAKISER